MAQESHSAPRRHVNGKRAVGLNPPLQDGDPRTPNQLRVEFAKEWAQWSVSVLGQELDTKARDRLIHRCGLECYRRAYGPP